MRLFQTIINLALRLLSLPGWRNPAILPTFEKSYLSQQSLKHRVFIPKSFKSGGPLLPLYLSIHGGGFALMQPRMDDRFCSEIANDNNIIVISLDYPKAPNHPFPASIIALIDVVNAILKDESLPLDRTKVAIGGFSAGANLSFAVSQDESLQGKIGGLLSFYGPMDFTTSTVDKMATRPAGYDQLEDMIPIINWAYVKQGQDLRDPRLSVTFAPKARLPPKIFILGCELDLLCRESEVLAERLATDGSGETVESSNSWEKNGIKWTKVLGEKHGMWYLAPG